MITPISSELVRIKLVRNTRMMMSLLVLMFMSASINAQSQTLSETMQTSTIGINGDGDLGNIEEATILSVWEISETRSSSEGKQTFINPLVDDWSNISGLGTSEITANSTASDTVPDCEPVSAIRDLTHSVLFNLVKVQFTTIPEVTTNRFYVYIRPQDPFSEVRERLIILFSDEVYTAEDGSTTHDLVINLAYDEIFDIELYYRFSSGCLSDVVRFTSERTETTDKVIEVGPNYPNPFNAATRIPFQLAEISYVSVDVYDIAGRRVYSMPPRLYGRSKQSIEMNLSNLASGMFIYHMKVQSRLTFEVKTGKMQLIK
ncbi:MAG: T9SS type A sorting domain-containing protein [Balneolales bacterium]|nr:T9SS type A sorting domain-containing protein [Balneolales bacterium]